VVFNFPNAHGPSALPMSGGVGAQYTPTAGWAQAITYYQDVLKDPAYDRAIAVVLGGDASVATNGFWAALTIATTQKLPMLFSIEDNGYGISVPASFQTPGATSPAIWPASATSPSSRRWHRAGRGRAAGGAGRRPRPRPQRAGAAAPQGPAAAGPLLSGHAGL
jgi:hypothetical protein